MVVVSLVGKEVEPSENFKDMSRACDFLSSLAKKTNEFYEDIFHDCKGDHKYLVNICRSSDQSARVRFFHVPEILYAVWDKRRYNEPNLEEGVTSYLDSGKEIIFSQLEDMLQVEEKSSRIFSALAPDTLKPAIYGVWKIFPEMEKDIYLAAVYAFHPGQLKGEEDRIYAEKIWTLKGDIESFLNEAHILVNPEIPIDKSLFSLEEIDDESTFRAFPDFSQKHFLNKR